MKLKPKDILTKLRHMLIGHRRIELWRQTIRSPCCGVYLEYEDANLAVTKMHCSVCKRPYCKRYTESEAATTARLSGQLLKIDDTRFEIIKIARLVDGYYSAKTREGNWYSIRPSNDGKWVVLSSNGRD